MGMLRLPDMTSCYVVGPPLLAWAGERFSREGGSGIVRHQPAYRTSVQQYLTLTVEVHLEKQLDEIRKMEVEPSAERAVEVGVANIFVASQRIVQLQIDAFTVLVPPLPLCPCATRTSNLLVSYSFPGLADQYDVLSSLYLSE